MPKRKSIAKKLFEEGVAQGFITNKGSWYSFGDHRLGNGKEAAIRVIDSNPEFTRLLTNKVKPAPEPQHTDRPVITPGPIDPEPIKTSGGEIDLANIGVREMSLTKQVPVDFVHPDGQVTTAIQTKEVREVIRQPLITVEEAKALEADLPKEKYHEFRLDRAKPANERRMTGVPRTGTHKGKRVMMTKAEFQRW